MTDTTLGQDLLEVVDDARSILGPRDLGLRPTGVSIVTRTWPSGTRGYGLPSDTKLDLPDYTKVRHVSQREIANSGGLYENGDVRVGPVTPLYTAIDNTTGGFTQAQLAPVVSSSSTEIIYRLREQLGASGVSGDYVRVELQRDRQLRFVLVLRRIQTTPGP